MFLFCLVMSPAELQSEGCTTATFFSKFARVVPFQVCIAYDVITWLRHSNPIMFIKVATLNSYFSLAGGCMYVCSRCMQGLRARMTPHLPRMSTSIDRERQNCSSLGFLLFLSPIHIHDKRLQDPGWNPRPWAWLKISDYDALDCSATTACILVEFFIISSSKQINVKMSHYNKYVSKWSTFLLERY